VEFGFDIVTSTPVVTSWVPAPRGHLKGVNTIFIIIYYYFIIQGGGYYG
jgi:hypothetical protein